MTTRELTESEVRAQAIELAGATPQRVLRFLFEALGDRAAIAFSGAEDVVLIDMAVELRLSFSVFFLDTGRHPPETYRFVDRVRKHYGIDLDVLFPDGPAVERLVRQKGLLSFYEDGHRECCEIRKVLPLKRALSRYAGWATGQRRDQSPTRSDVDQISWDTSHTPGGMVKVNPLTDWSLDKVWKYIRAADVPYNELHDQGYVSLGCAPCTRALRPGEHERAGRWWWELETRRECGLHASPGEDPPAASSRGASS